MTTIGYVVIEWNQASGQPELASGTYPYPTRADAAEYASMMRRLTDESGRGERYGVAALAVPA